MGFKRLGFILWFVLTVSMSVFAQQQQGILFRSYESPIANRSTLHLSPDAPLNVDQFLEIRFEFSMWRVSELGYLLRFSTATLSTRIDLLYMPGIDGDAGGIFKLTVNGEEQDLKLVVPYEKLVRNRWVAAKLLINRSEGIVELNIDGQRASLTNALLKNLAPVNPVFGKSPYSLPSAVATPRFGIKNLQLNLDSDTHVWPLRKQMGQELLSEDRECSLEVQNPEWIADLHSQWQLRQTLSASPIPGLTFDTTGAEVYVVDDAIISIYNLIDQSVTEFKPSNRFPKDQGTQAAIYSTLQQQLYGYNLGPVKGYEFNKSTSAWENEPKGEAPPIYIWQHTPFENALNGNPMIFAGYGFFTARNSLLEFDPNTQEWGEVPLQGNLPEPRFMHGMAAGFTTGEYFIYGGYGNESGDQDLGFQNLNDLYILNLKDSSIRQIWAEAPGSTEFLPSSSMVLSVDDSSLYALGHNYLSGAKNLELLKISINEPKVEVVELKEKLPFEIRNIGDYNLFLYHARQTNELVSVLRLNTDDSHAEVRIYTMAFPPMGLKNDQEPTKTGSLPWYWVAIGGLIILTLVVSLTKKRSQPIREITRQEPAGPAIESPVKVLGGFKLTDAEGQDITAKLSPKLKELFLLILLHSVNHKGGISTKNLTEILWPDGTTASAKNNRGVSLQKLRHVLKSLPAVEVQFSENKWKINLNDSTTCDLHHVSHLLDSNEVEKIPGSISGPLLYATTYEWLDSIKVDVHHKLIQQITSLIQDQERINHWPHVVNLSRSILLIDPVNDDALHYQVSALIELKKAGQAKASYEQFTERYKQLYNEPYPITFDEISA